jgi:quercetin dioxygenase-like cupin family protein
MTHAVVMQDSDVALDRWSDPVRGRVGFRTLLGGPATRTADFTAGVTELEPDGWLGRHRHSPSEVYYVLEGEGTLTIDGATHVVSAGTTVYIPGDSEHGIRNTGTGRLRFFYAFGVGSFDQIEYRFSDVR